MKIKRIKIYYYQLPLNHTIQIQNKTIELRQGIILRLTDEVGNDAFGDIAPLPGLHTENINESIAQLRTISKNLPEIPAINVRDILDTPIKFPGDSEWYPSVRFGIESAMLNLVMSQKKDLSDAMDDIYFTKTIAVNALLFGDYNTVIKSVSQKIDERFSCFKLKVGRQAIDADIEMVNAVYKVIGQKAALRLDANRAWNLRDALYFIEGVKNCHIEFIEEPVRNPADIAELERRTNIPVALDESLTERKFDLDISQLKNRVLVIKPAVIGSVNKTFQLVKFARKYGLTAVISDTYNSGVGLSFLIWIASLVGKNTAMGFDTYSTLADDILSERHTMVKGMIEVSCALARAKKLKWDNLDEIYLR